jgi:hypothetical protein
MFENRVLRRIFGRKREEVTGRRRTFNNEELCNLGSSSDIIRVIESWRVRWAMRAARMENTNASVIAYHAVKAYPGVEMKLHLFST